MFRMAKGLEFREIWYISVVVDWSISYGSQRLPYEIDQLLRYRPLYYVITMSVTHKIDAVQNKQQLETNSKPRENELKNME